MGMNEYEQHFTTNLQAKLKTKIKGKIYCEVNWHDEIYVKIINADNVKYEHRITHFSERFLNGWSTDYAAYEIVKEYKRFIFEELEKKYFYSS